MNNIEKNSSRNVFLDLFKLFLCFLVISIHVLNKTYSHYPLYRIAVPMFFMISGYFLYDKDHEKMKNKGLNFIKRSAKYMIIGTLIYTIFELICFIKDGTSIGWFFTTLFYEGNDIIFNFFIFNAPVPYYTVGAQLWFLIALFIVAIVHYLLVKYKKLHWYYVIIPAALVIYFFFSGYMYLIQEDTALPFRYMRNAWFFGLPTFGLGFIGAKIDWNKKSWYRYIYLLLAIVFFFLQIVEHNLIAPSINRLEMYITGIISSFFFLQFFLSFKKANCKFYYKWIGKSASFYIYILHMLVSVSIRNLSSIENSYLYVLIVFLVSFLIYEIVFLLKKLYFVLIKKVNF